MLIAHTSLTSIRFLHLSISSSSESATGTIQKGQHFFIVPFFFHSVEALTHPLHRMFPQHGWYVLLTEHAPPEACGIGRKQIGHSSLGGGSLNKSSSDITILSKCLLHSEMMRMLSTFCCLLAFYVFSNELFYMHHCNTSLDHTLCIP